MPPRRRPSAREQQLEKLLEVSLSLGGTLHLETLLERIIRTSCEVLQAEGASLLLVDESTGRLRFAHVVVPPEAAHIVETLKGLTLRPGEGIAGTVAQSNEPLLISNTRQDPRWSPRMDEATGYVTRDLICVPLAVEGQVLGVLEVLNKKVGSYNQDDMPLCMGFANVAASALSNAQLHRGLEEAHARLREMESTRTHYISTLSHELRTPITVVKGYVQVLQQFRSRLEEARQQEFLQSIEREADRLASLIDDLFVVNEIQDLPGQCSFVEVDAADLVRRFLEHWSLLHADHRFTPDLADGPLMVCVDRKKITHALYHLVDNATKFSPAQSEVVVRLRLHPDGALHLDVTDRGIGIPASIQHRIFDPFWQADSSDTRQYGGLGLGLFIVREIVRVHGGEVACESRVGDGTAFHVRLPRRG
ncbi:MAG: GAF domain-containing sensor histidine kinase [Candidatus Xenobia bacterium]